MIVCYIIYSPNLDKYYTGITQDDVGSRLQLHNQSGYGIHYTSQSDDWELFLSIECETVSQSMKIERHIKAMKSRKYIQNLKCYPEISKN